MSSEPLAETAPDTAAGLFGLLSDETRICIVRALYRQHRSDPDDYGLSFSTLAARVDVDDTGRFNYHLGRLRGTLVEKRGRRYVLTPLGTVLGAVAAGDVDCSDGA